MNEHYKNANGGAYSGKVETRSTVKKTVFQEIFLICLIVSVHFHILYKRKDHR
jgi:hypothetical protein